MIHSAWFGYSPQSKEHTHSPTPTPHNHRQNSNDKKKTAEEEETQPDVEQTYLVVEAGWPVLCDPDVRVVPE